jgi:biopolymer transport protein ExbB
MLENILDGGVIMIPLMLLSVLVFAVIIDRVRAFKVAEKDPSLLRKDIIKHLEEGSVDEAIKDCESFQGPVAAVLLVGLIKFRKLVKRGKSLTEIEENVNRTMNDYAPHVISVLEKRLNYLTMIAGVAPLLGMTGTVTGMIRSFKSMAASGMDATAVSSGISEALITTAAGLIIAIPAVVAYNIFSKKTDRFILEIESSATELIDQITLDHEVED